MDTDAAAMVRTPVRRRGRRTPPSERQVRIELSARPAASPILPTEIEEEAEMPPPPVPRIRPRESESTEVPVVDPSIASILNRLQVLERRTSGSYDPPASAGPRDTDGYPELRRDYRRDTIFTEGGTAISHSKPKMEKPETYNGEYSVLYSVLNWLQAVRKYLKPHKIHQDEYPQYAYTYMGKHVKAWYDGRFGDYDPTWKVFVAAIQERYLPEDHVIQVTKRYENIVQTGSLMDYVEKWQSLMVAVNAAGIVRTDKDHVIQFVTGLARLEDRKSILDKEPENLEDVYRAVTRIRHYSLLAHKYTRTAETGIRDRNREGRKGETQLKMRQGKEKEKAFREKRCIGCGKAGHFVVNCDAVRGIEKKLKAIRRYEKGTEKASVRDDSKKSPTTGKRKGVRFHLAEVEEESENDYESGPELGDSEPESGTEIEEEDESDGQDDGTGNGSPDPQGGDH